jgi:hypothetical protein
LLISHIFFLKGSSVYAVVNITPINNNKSTLRIYPLRADLPLSREKMKIEVAKITPDWNNSANNMP